MKILKLILFLLLGSILLSATETDTSYTNGQFLCSGIGSGFGSYKDMGTSPLLYRGISGILVFGCLSESAERTWEYRMNTNYFGGFINPNYTLGYFSEEIQLSYLHTIPVFSRSDIFFKAGGRLSTSVAGAFNPAYENASFNIDLFASMSAQAQITYVFERPEKKLKRHTIPKTQYAAFYNIDLPVLLFNARPKFSYVPDGSGILFDKHYFLGGFRMQNKIGIRLFLPNGNAMDITYLWKMFTSGAKDIYRLETASHNLQLSYYFKLD